MNTQQKITSQILSWPQSHNKITDQEAKDYAKEIGYEVFGNATRELVKCRVCNKNNTTNPSGICNNCL